MSEIEAELNRAAATYWLSVAAKAGPGQTPSLAKATTLLRDARAESRIPEGATQPTLNQMEAPPLDMPNVPRLRR